MPPADRPRRLGSTDALWQLVPDPHDRAADHGRLVALAALALESAAVTLASAAVTLASGHPAAVPLTSAGRPAPAAPTAVPLASAGHLAPVAPTAGSPAARATPTLSLHLTHHCPTCGSDDHGRPAVLDAAQHPVVHVSLSRAHGFVALAASPTTPIGIDIESLAAVRAAALDTAAFDPSERAAFAAAAPGTADRMRAQAWTAKEAVLKALGTGLRLDPQAIGLDWAADPAHPKLVRSTDPRVDPAAFALHSLGGDLPEGLAGTVALLRAVALLGTAPLTERRATTQSGSFGNAFS